MNAAPDDVLSAVLQHLDVRVVSVAQVSTQWLRVVAQLPAWNTAICSGWTLHLLVDATECWNTTCKPVGSEPKRFELSLPFWMSPVPSRAVHAHAGDGVHRAGAAL